MSVYKRQATTRSDAVVLQMDVVDHHQHQHQHHRHQHQQLRHDDGDGEKGNTMNASVHQQQHRYLPHSQMSWLVSLARTEMRLLLAGFVALVAASVASLIIPSMVGALVDQSNTESAAADSLSLPRGLLAVVVVLGVATCVRSYSLSLAGERIVCRLRAELFAALCSQEVAFFDAARTGELLHVLSADTACIEGALTTNLGWAVRNVVYIVGGFGVLLATSWRLCLVMAAVVPIVTLAVMAHFRHVRRVSAERQGALADASSLAEESLANIRTVKAFARERRQRTLYTTALDRTFAVSQRLALAQGTFHGFTMLAGYLALVAVLWYGSLLVQSGHISLGTLASFAMYAVWVAVSLGGLSSLWFEMGKALGATRRVHEILTRTPHPTAGGHTGSSPYIAGVYGPTPPLFSMLERGGHIAFRDVHFCYPTRPDTPVLRGMTLDIRPGRVVALVGTSGGGKSTTAALLQRFYDPDSGSITLDGVDYRSLDPAWLRGQIGVVSQEPVLFNTTIRENIAFARDGWQTQQQQNNTSGDSGSTTDQEKKDPVVQGPDDGIVQAAMVANAHEFISQFKDGYDTLVGERGVRLSGGQRQRIAIARAVLQSPRILLFDEATSALDAESEFLVQQALERLMAGRTVLVIAHRLSTVKSAHCVCVVSDGRVIESGTHDQLLADPDSHYSRLVHRQLL